MKNFWAKQGQLIIIALLVIGITFYAGYRAGLRSRPAVEMVAGLEYKEEGKPTAVDFSPFWKAWNILDAKYVSSSTTTSPRERVWGAIEGLAASLKDPYTVFFPPESAKLFQSEISGSFEGIGMEIGIKDETLTVIAPLKGTPAERAGILPGDKILKINDAVTAGMPVESAIKLIRGKKGTEVGLTILHETSKIPSEIKVTRDTIAIPTIDTELRSGANIAVGSSSETEKNGIFILRLYSFSANSPDLFRSGLRKFVQSDSNKLIIDLRGNPGGYLEAAVDVASWFLPVGAVVVSEDFGKNAAPIIYRSKGYDFFNRNLKLVILVNGGSASASEILAGALREHGVAQLVGTKTFGKGSVQELVDITPETSLKVTVARWLTPKGNSISEKGITPDLVVPVTPEDIAKHKDPQMEAALRLITNNK